VRSELPLKQWARILWLGSYSEENFIGLLYASYFDASGQAVKGRILSVCGAVAPVKKWERFVPEWRAALAAENVTEFHATDFAASAGEFSEWKGDRERRRRFIASLIAVVKKNVNKLFSVSCELDAWDDVNKQYLLEECFYSPYALCGNAAVRQLMKWAKKKRVTQRNLKIIFEEGDVGWGGLQKLCRAMAVEPISLPKSEAIPCQLADWIAWKSRIAFTNGVEKFDRFMSAPTISNADIEELIKENRSLENILVIPGAPGVLGRKRLIENCELFGVPKRPLRERT
jgi:hypothetical protein